MTTTDKGTPAAPMPEAESRKGKGQAVTIPPAKNPPAPWTIRGKRAARTAKAQAEKAARRKQGAAACFPVIDDAFADDFVKNTVLGFQKQSLFNDLWFDPGFSPFGMFICDEWRERVEARIKALGLGGVAAAMARQAFYILVSIRSAMEISARMRAEQQGAPKPKRRGAGRKKTPAMPAPDYFVMLDRPEFAAIAQMIGTEKVKNSTLDNTIKTTVYQAEGVSLYQDRTGEAEGAAPDVTVDQLLKMAVIGLTQNNNISGTTGRTGGSINREIAFSLTHYAELRGKDITPHEDAEPQKERERIKAVIKHVRQEADRDARHLLGAHLSFRGRDKDGKAYTGIYNIFEKYEIKGGVISFVFTEDAAKMAIKSPLTWISSALFRLNGYTPDAYKIACKAGTYFMMDANHDKPKAHILLVKTLLGYTDIRTPGESEEAGQAWQYSRDKLEGTLNRLKTEGFITGWRYCGQGGAQLTPGQLQTLRGNKTQWQDARIWLDYPPAPDQSERIKRKEQKRAEQQKRRERSRLGKLEKDVKSVKKCIYRKRKTEAE